MNLPQRPPCSCQQTRCEEEKAVTGGCHLTLGCVHSAAALLPPAWFWGLAPVMETSPKAAKAVARAVSPLGEKTHQGTVPVSTSTTNLTWQGTHGVAGCWGSQQGGWVCLAVGSNLSQSSFATDFSRAGISALVVPHKGEHSHPTQAQLL